MCGAGSGSTSIKNPYPHRKKKTESGSASGSATLRLLMAKTDAAFPFQSYDSHIAMNPGYVRRHVAGTAKDAARTDSLWRLTRSFRVHVLLATYVNVKARMENILTLIDW
jgi:hypothetical protein